MGFRRCPGGLSFLPAQGSMLGRSEPVGSRTAAPRQGTVAAAQGRSVMSGSGTQGGCRAAGRAIPPGRRRPRRLSGRSRRGTVRSHGSLAAWADTPIRRCPRRAAGPRHAAPPEPPAHACGLAKASDLTGRPGRRRPGHPVIDRPGPCGRRAGAVLACPRWRRARLSATSRSRAATSAGSPGVHVCCAPPRRRSPDAALADGPCTQLRLTRHARFVTAFACGLSPAGPCAGIGAVAAAAMR